MRTTDLEALRRRQADLLVKPYHWPQDVDKTMPLPGPPIRATRYNPVIPIAYDHGSSSLFDA